MARARNVKPGFFANDELAECSPHARLLFIGLWLLADREGRLEERPRKIRAEIFPYENVECESLLNELSSRGFIARYSVDQLKFIAIPTFGKHQNPHKNERQSEIPPPNYGNSRNGASTLVRVPEPSRENPIDSNSQSELSDTCTIAIGLNPFPLPSPDSGFLNDEDTTLIPESEFHGDFDEVISHEQPQRVEQPHAKEPPVLVFPCEGKTAKWNLTQSQIDEWQRLHPSLAVLSECRNAYTWVTADPANRKTARGMTRFLVNWLIRVNQRGGSRLGPVGGHPNPPRDIPDI